MVAKSVRVTGRVQGVGFRWYAMNRARRLGIGGWVRNNPDGSVSAWLEGAENDVDAMIAALREGPPGSRVREVTVETSVPTGGYAGFDVAF